MMKLRKATMNEKEEQINTYIARTLKDLKHIKPKWACGENINELLDVSLHPFNDKYKIFIVQTKELILKTEFYDFNPEVLFTGNYASDYRVVTTLFQWENERSIDPPTVTLSSHDVEKLTIADGRHRTKAAYLLGLEQIPIAVHIEMITSIGKIIDLSAL